MNEPSWPELERRRLIAVLGGDPAVAHAAAARAQVYGVRLSLVQTWSAPLPLWGLTSPAVMHLNHSRARALEEIVAAAEERLRAIMRALEPPVAVDFRCRRGCVSRVAISAARSEVYDLVVIPDCLLVRLLVATRALVHAPLIAQVDSLVPRVAADATDSTTDARCWAVFVPERRNRRLFALPALTSGRTARIRRQTGR